MDSGINNPSLPILSIAIPTWNRASTMDKALEFLLPQVDEFKQYIEVVISDNASEDNTAEIVNKHMSKYPNIAHIYNKNEVNVGFFGNFKKCRELSTGKYLWILSDDDFVCDNILFELIENLSKGGEYATVFLKNNFRLNSIKKSELIAVELLEKETYNLGLISSVIFLNEKSNDKFLFDRYSQSPFIGFIFMLNSFSFKNLTLTVEGKCLLAANHVSSVTNFFDVFINGMEDVINYLSFTNTSAKIIKSFRKEYLRSFILPSYVLYKAEKERHFTDSKSISIKTVEECIKNRYSDLLYYWFLFFPFAIVPRSILAFALKFYQFLKN